MTLHASYTQLSPLLICSCELRRLEQRATSIKILGPCVHAQNPKPLFSCKYLNFQPYAMNTVKPFDSFVVVQRTQPAGAPLTQRGAQGHAWTGTCAEMTITHKEDLTGIHSLHSFQTALCPAQAGKQPCALPPRRSPDMGAKSRQCACSQISSFVDTHGLHQLASSLVPCPPGAQLTRARSARQALAAGA